MTISSDLCDRLRRHYIKPGQDMPGGVFVPEVGLNGEGQQRRCDAIYVGFTSTTGRTLVGHEIKVSRADWRHELDQPDKAETWASQCHAWYVVAPSTEIVPKEELPPGWGLLVPNARSKNRMDVLVKAYAKPPNHQPSWLITRSILARLDTLQHQERWTVRQEERDRAQAEAEERATRLAALGSPQASRDRELVDRLGQALGVDLRGDRPTIPYVSATQLAQALQVVAERDTLIRRYNGLDGQARDLRDAADRLVNLHQLLTEAVV